MYYEPGQCFALSGFLHILKIYKKNLFVEVQTEKSAVKILKSGFSQVASGFGSWVRELEN